MITFLSILGLALVGGAWLHYLAMIPRERVPRRPVGHGALMALGSLMALAAVVLALATGDGSLVLAAVLAGVTVGLAGYFFWLLRQAALPADRLSFVAGDPLPRFKAFDAEGRPFDSASLDGRRFFLKFFRGHW
jgi:hypothetical protein